MSIFRPTAIACPACDTPVPFALVHSVNAGRRADLRAAILDGSFQRESCPACRHVFRLEPEFTYTDLGRRQFHAVWPAERVTDWRGVEQRSRDTFAQAFGSGAPGAARALGDGLAVRAVFGWPGLEEKLHAAEAGIDDATLELAKIAVLRNLGEMPVGPDAELRLVGQRDETLLLGWIRTATGDPTSEIAVPRAVLAEIEAAPADWQPLRDQLLAGPFVDLRRMLIG